MNFCFDANGSWLMNVFKVFTERGVCALGMSEGKGQ